MEFDGDRPIFMQLAHIFIQKVVSKELNVGDKLQSVRDIAKEYKVNPNTVNKSIDELVNTGIFEVKRGLGTFVIEDEKTVEKKRINFLRKRINEIEEEFSNMGIDKKELVELIMENDNGKNS